MNMPKLPPIDQALIDYLDSYFPDTAPDPSWSEREVWMRRGSVEVVRTLKRFKELQDEDMLS